MTMTQVILYAAGVVPLLIVLGWLRAKATKHPDARPGLSVALMAVLFWLFVGAVYVVALPITGPFGIGKRIRRGRQ